MTSSVPSLEDRFDDLEEMEEMYHNLEGLAEVYDNENLNEALETIEESLDEEPDYGISMSLERADRFLEEFSEECGREHRADITYARQVISQQLGSYPAHGTERHYNLELQQKNL